MVRNIKLTVGLIVAAAAIALMVNALALAAKPGGGGSTGPSYQIVALDTQGDLFEGSAFDINNNTTRIVAGQAFDPILGLDCAACWTVNLAGGTATSSLHVLDGEIALAVNDFGEIVGGRNGQAVYWSNFTAAPLALPVPVGSTRSMATGINHNGLICGWFVRDIEGQLENVAVVWHVTVSSGVPAVSNPIELPKLIATDATRADAINDTNAQGIALVVGNEWTPGAIADGAPVAWSIGLLPDGTLAVNPAPDVLDLQGFAYGVNKSGAICGEVGQDAVVWNGNVKHILDRSATITLFGPKRNCESATAWATNNGGVIVGYGGLSPFSKAVVWSNPSAPMTLLDKFLKNVRFTELNHAFGINDAGEIVGYGWDSNRSFRPAFLAIPK